MTTTLGQLLEEHPDNGAYNPGYKSGTNKGWAKKFSPDLKLRNRTRNVDLGDGNYVVVADFDESFLPEQPDDISRRNQLVFPPNIRSWRLEQEEDYVTWFHAEVSNIVAGFSSSPPVLQQSQPKPYTEEKHDESIDIVYTIKHNKERLPLAIGELKRNLIDPIQWLDKRLRSATQKSLARELRGYAYKYRCPHAFCFDGAHFLMLQFRADTPEGIKDIHCDVDFWLIPIDNLGGSTLRTALYRLMVQGLRRCQGARAVQPLLHGYPPALRRWFSGEPFWNVGNGVLESNPWGYTRYFDASTGAVWWMHGDNRAVDESGNPIWDCMGLWENNAGQDQMVQAGVDDYPMGGEAGAST
ncbi:uncharacterized protein C8A04DRAFT_12250 [Dichotomopilus funicola]|uniref:Uncharacterized protein n=1 Tax=Dichotomopilus funicola TaxID=1934379 RepID=A0AAN6V2D5_9PEZI|nr:hypothetical protein C8A04DRAFT_12250 [Dichotomopilus funicola]